MLLMIICPLYVPSLQSVKYVIHENTIASLMYEVHASFMMSEAPMDSHRKNVLNFGVTHVGIGFYLSDKHFRLVEVYASRYVTLLDKSPDGADTAPGFNLSTDETYVYAKVSPRAYYPYPSSAGLQQRSALCWCNRLPSSDGPSS